MVEESPLIRLFVDIARAEVGRLYGPGEPLVAIEARTAHGFTWLLGIKPGWLERAVKLPPDLDLTELLNAARATPSTTPPTSPPWPPPDGWHFRVAEFSFDGKVYPLVGKKLELLKALAERPGEFVGYEELRRRVWKDYPIEDGGIRTQVSLLRQELKKLMGLGEEEEVIAGAGGGYRLLIV